MSICRGGGNQSLAPSRLAFTLAEVLITLGIIGVVAAVTMPMLIANYQKKVTVNGLKVAYSLFSQALESSVQENGSMSDWEYSYTDMPPKYIFPYIETTGIVKKYTMYTTYGNKDKYGDQKFGFLYWGGWTSGKIYSLKNGMTYSLIYDNGNLILTVDINGVKGPNRLGRDGFVFYLDTKKDKLMPYAFGQSRTTLLKDCTKNGDWMYYDGMACAFLIMSDGWQIKDDYPW